MRIKLFFFEVIGLFLISFFLISVQADEDIISGFNTVRLENEYKINVPINKVNEIKNYLYDTYITQEGKWLGDSTKTQTGQEIFIDIYFDTPKLKILKKNGGLRHRVRIIDGKVEKELIQLKISNENDSLTREEIKFNINDVPNKGDALAGHEFFGILAKKDRTSFLEYLNSNFNIDNPIDLKKMLMLYQNRTRFYIQQPNKGFVYTITLDNVNSKKYWINSEFYEIEFELNEIAYTEANVEKKEWMLELSKKIKEDLTNKFPYLQQDQTPKYQKSFYALENKFYPRFLFRLLIKG